MSFKFQGLKLDRISYKITSGFKQKQLITQIKIIKTSIIKLQCKLAINLYVNLVGCFSWMISFLFSHGWKLLK